MRLGHPFLDVRISENRVFRLEAAVSKLYDAFKVLEAVSPSRESNVSRQGQLRSPPPVLVPQSLLLCSWRLLQLALQPVGRLCVLVLAISIYTHEK